MKTAETNLMDLPKRFGTEASCTDALASLVEVGKTQHQAARVTLPDKARSWLPWVYIAIGKHLDREALVKLCDPTDDLGQAGVMVDRVFARL